MRDMTRLLTGVSLALLAAGGAGVATHRGDRGTPPARVATTVTPPPSSAPTTRPSPPPPDAAALQQGLVTPTDMGGYYRTTPASASALFASSPCLAAAAGPAAPAARAATALLGPDAYSVPTIVEAVASYGGRGATAAYQAAVKGLAACPELTFGFGGDTVHAALRPRSIPPVGEADAVWAGQFGAFGATFSVQVGTVLQGQDVLLLAWIDIVPPSGAIMGSFVSTLSLAIGKLA